MTQTRTTPSPVAADVGGISDAWTTRVGACLGVASIVLVAAGFAIAMPAEATLTSSESEVVAFYTGAGLAKTLTGGVVEVLGLALFLPFAAMIASRVHGPGVAGDLFAPTARMAATVYVAIALAPGMSAGAAALWLAHHGTSDAAVLTALNDLRSMSYLVALLPFAIFLVVVGTAGRTTRGLPAWASLSAVVIGIALAASLPFATAEVPDMIGLVGLLWVMAVSVALLRRPERAIPVA